MQKAPPTPKGFRDILPQAAKVRRQVVNKIADVLENEGFSPIETPIVEFAETLSGKYGEEERLIYKFTDRGERELALRYDLTVPLTRFIASNQGLIQKGPFRRYQIGQVFRGENPQHGRWREFTQLDFDTVGSDSLEEDAKIIAAAINAVKTVGLPTPLMLVNDRKNFEGLPKEVVIALDKFEKIGEGGITRELIDKGVPKDQVTTILQSMRNKTPTTDLEKIFTSLKELGIGAGEYQFSPFLARGLDYYTGTIFELKPNSDPSSLSIGAGGRYDNLIGMFAGRQVPAVGFSFGIDRLIEALPNEA